MNKTFFGWTRWWNLLGLLMILVPIVLGIGLVIFLMLWQVPVALGIIAWGVGGVSLWLYKNLEA